MKHFMHLLQPFLCCRAFQIEKSYFLSAIVLRLIKHSLNLKKRYVHSFYLYFLIASSSSSITNSVDYQHIIAVSYRYFLKLDCRNISFDKYASNWIARYFTYIQSKMINIPKEAVTLTAFLQHILVPSDINRFKSFRVLQHLGRIHFF